MADEKVTDKAKAADAKAITGPINEAALAERDMSSAEREKKLGGRDPQLTYPTPPPEGHALDGSVIDETRHNEAMEARKRILNPESATEVEHLSEEDAQHAAEETSLAEHEDLKERQRRADELKESLSADREGVITGDKSETGTGTGTAPAVNANATANTPATTTTAPAPTGSTTTNASTPAAPSTATPSTGTGGSTT